MNLVFHIGFHKTGTTWLQKKYFSNKNVFEILNNFHLPWQDELLQGIIRTDPKNFKLNKVKNLINIRCNISRINVITAERLSGHPLSGGYDSIEIANRLKKINSNAKIIVTEREPKSFVVSVYKQMLREGFCGNSKDFLNNNNWKTVSRSKAYFLQKDIIREYIELFGEDNVLVLTFEEFKQNKIGYLSKIEKFLCIKESTFNDKHDKHDKIINKTFSNNRLRAIKLLNRFRKTEYNQIPLINVGNKGVVYLSKLIAFLFTKKPLISKSEIEDFLNA